MSTDPGSSLAAAALALSVIACGLAVTVYWALVTWRSSPEQWLERIQSAPRLARRGEDVKVVVRKKAVG